MPILLFANGDIEDTTWLRPYLAQATVILAADGGTRHILAAGFRPDVVIGDLDSLPEATQHQLKEQQTQFVLYPRYKNETDLELALMYVVKHYPQEELWLFGLLGGRVDQMLANIFLLAHPMLTHQTVRLIEPHQQAWLVHHHTIIQGEIGDKVSLIPLGGDVVVQKTSGLKWPLYAELLAFGPARGVSNELTAGEATISIAKGKLLCIHTGRSWER